MNVVSGELYYYLNENPLPLTSETFTNYLNGDKNLEHIKKSNKKRLDQLRYLRKNISTLYRDNIIKQYDEYSRCLLPLLNSTTDAYKQDNFMKKIKINSIKSEFDTKLLQTVIEYGSICRDEVMRSRMLLKDESIEVIQSKYIAKIIHDMYVFAHHLGYESHQRVLINMLLHDSQHAIRCRKAVYDNCKQPYLYSIGITRINIELVFKLENSILSKHLEVAADRVNNKQPNETKLENNSGKIKGLFCIIPKGLIYSFCTYGLGIQPIPFSTDKDKRTESHSNTQIQAEFQSNIDSNVFCNIPWFYYPVAMQSDPNSSSNSKEKCVRNMVNEPGYAERMVARSTKYFIENPSECPVARRDKLLRKISKSEKDRDGTARKSSVQRVPKEPSSYLRFYRHSSPLNIEQIEPIEERGGYFLALCRVLMSKVKVIPFREGVGSHPSEMSDKDIAALEKQGYDSIFIQQTEEYIILHPQHVLPEFVMYVQYNKSDNNSRSNTSGKSEALDIDGCGNDGNDACLSPGLRVIPDTGAETRTGTNASSVGNGNVSNKSGNGSDGLLKPVPSILQHNAAHQSLFNQLQTDLPSHDELIHGMNHNLSSHMNEMSGSKYGCSKDARDSLVGLNVQSMSSCLLNNELFGLLKQKENSRSDIGSGADDKSVLEFGYDTVGDNTINDSNTVNYHSLERIVEAHFPMKHQDHRGRYGAHDHMEDRKSDSKAATSPLHLNSQNASTSAKFDREADRDVITNSILIAKRKQELCSIIGKTIVQTVQDIHCIG